MGKYDDILKVVQANKVNIPTLISTAVDNKKETGSYDPYGSVQNYYNGTANTPQTDWNNVFNTYKTAFDGQYSALNNELTGLKTSYGDLQNSYTGLQGQYTDLNGKYDSLNTLLDEYGKKYTALNSRHNSLNSQFKNQQGAQQKVANSATGDGSNIQGTQQAPTQANDSLYKYLSNMWQGGM